MKKKLFLAFFIVASFATKMQAQPSCQSIFSSAAKIFDNISREYIDFRMEAAQVFVDIVTPGKQGAGTATDELFDKATKMQIDLYNSYGVITGESNATIGAVNLIVPLKTWTGDLYTERTFQILQSPYDKIVIKIKKTGGGRGVKFTACAKYSNGSPYDRKSGEIDKDAMGVERTITFAKNMSDKNISLHLVGEGSTALNKCDYKLTIEGYFNEDEMQKIYDENDLGKNKENKNKGNKNNKTELKPKQINQAGTRDSTGFLEIKAPNTKVIENPKAVEKSGRNTNGNKNNRQKPNNTKLDDLKNPFDTLKTNPKRVKSSGYEEVSFKRNQNKNNNKINNTDTLTNSNMRRVRKGKLNN